LGISGKMGQDALMSQAGRIRDTVLRYARESVTISVGPSVAAFQDLVQSYLSALKALEERPIQDREPILQGSGLDWNREPQAKQTIEQVKELARRQFHQNINLRLIAGQIYMNSTYLGQLFKMHEGVSFQQYLLKLRMEHAKELLVNTDKRVYEIAAEVGYREMDWFYKKFREYTGKSPGEFRGEP
jgi:YesN/AraC family two-component response regulator